MTAPSNANTSGLAPCPFCGGEAWLNDYEAKYSDLPPMSRAPQCRSCGASLGYLTTPAKATEAWNRRVTAASAQAMIDAAEARADRLAKGIVQAEILIGDAIKGIQTAPLSVVTDTIWTADPCPMTVVEALQLARAALQQETQK